VGIDANAAALRHGFRRAQKAKLTNTLFVVAAAETLPGPFAGSATEVRIHLPWGSLLTSLLGGNRQVLGGIAGLLRPGGRLTVLASAIEHDGIEGFQALDDTTAPAVAARVTAACDDLHLESSRRATAAEVAAAHSTWAKRLGAGKARPAWLFEFCRA
jgi:16S rRNA (adenine(1408)-N(1))-methyltransferase